MDNNDIINRVEDARWDSGDVENYLGSHREQILSFLEDLYMEMGYGLQYTDRVTWEKLKRVYTSALKEFSVDDSERDKMGIPIFKIKDNNIQDKPHNKKGSISKVLTFDEQQNMLMNKFTEWGYFMKRNNRYEITDKITNTILAIIMGIVLCGDYWDDKNKKLHINCKIEFPQQNIRSYFGVDWNMSQCRNQLTFIKIIKQDYRLLYKIASSINVD